MTVATTLIQRRYFDNAATSWPKPEAVYIATDYYQRRIGVSVGRAATRQGTEAQKIVDRARRRVAQLLNAELPRSIVFTFNGTDALNLAIHGWLSAGDHVITSAAEHNSILRPLRVAQERLSVMVDYVAVDTVGRVDPDAIARLIRPRTRLIALTQASNVTGTLQPVADVARIAREADVALLLDAAQTAGHVPIDVRALGVDLMACSGHKGLLGPLGTGILYVRPGRERELRPLRQGGTGSVSESERPPESMPDRFEAGNHNAPGLAGLDAAVAWILEQGQERLRTAEVAHTQRLLDRLAALPGLHLPGPMQAENRVGVVAMSCDGFDSQSLAAILDDEFGIESRAGLHCAPRMHRALGTLETGGLLRLSLGPFTTTEDIDAVADALAALTGATPGLR